MDGTKKTAIVICNYNMPERTDALCRRIIRTVKQLYQLFVVDNGSDLVPPSEYTNVYIEENCQTTGGFLAGINVARKLEFDYYWLIITSTAFMDDERDPLGMLLPLMDDDVYAVSPAVIFNDSAWSQWMSPRTPPTVRRVWGVDYLCALIDAKKYHEIGGLRPELTMMWGNIGECNWKARQKGWKILVNDNYVVEKETNIGYTMDRMNMTAKDRGRLATEQCENILAPIYGEDFRDKFRFEYTELGVNGDY